MKLAVLDWYTVSVSGDISTSALEQFGDVNVISLTKPEETAANIGDADIVLCNKVLITKEVMDAYPNIKYIGLFATGRRDFGNGASRQTSIDTGCEVGANYALNQFVTFTTSFSYTYTDYEGTIREDDEYCGRVGVTYKPNKFLTLGANYRYLDNASNVAAACYMQHLVDISVSIKY